MITKGTFWSGMFADPRGHSESTPMVLEIKESDGKTFSGTNTYRKNRLKIKGSIEDTNVYFVEYEVLGGKALIPNIYQGHLVEDSISGIAIHGDLQATFYIEQQK